jgi:hypothetical protein
MGALFSPGLRTHFADWEGDVVAVAGSVGHDLREVGFSDLVIPDNVYEAVSGSMLPFSPRMV